MLKAGERVDIVRVEAIGEHSLRLHFSDAHRVEVDFGPFLASSAHPETRRFLDPDEFRTYRIEWGNLVWGDYALCFPIADLYAGQLIANERLAVAEDGVPYGGESPRPGDG